MKEISLFEQTLVAFEKADTDGWSLNQLVQYILTNHVVTTYDNAMTRFIEYRVFFLGYLKLEFNLHRDSEPLEIETDYCLYFKLSFVDNSGEEIKVLRNSEIFCVSYVLLFKVPAMNEEVPGLEESVQLAITQTLAPLNLEKKGGLLSYIKDEFNKDLSNIQTLDFNSLLMYLSLNAEKFRLKSCTEAQLEKIDENMGVSLPQFYKRFLRVVGLGNKLNPHLVSNVEGFEYSRGNELFVFATDIIDFALFLGLKDDPNQMISHQWTTDNPYGDSPYSTFQTFREYVAEQIIKFETK
ncbi:MAG TPA: hypothetical protein DCS93_43870 [Microscillaceae bacterium]|nr:hypothetical protein [Microscillaceae bacterium]